MVRRRACLNGCPQDITATLAVGLVPGVLLTLLWRPRPTSILEVAGFGIAISFGFAQLLTILAVSAHLSPVVISRCSCSCRRWWVVA